MSLNAFAVFTVPFALASSADRNNSLDGIDTTHIETGTFGWVQGGPAANTLFYLDKSDTTTPPDGTTVVQPLTGPGRWLLFGQPGAKSCSSQYGFDTVDVNPASPLTTPYVALTEGANFMFPNAHSVAPGTGTPIQVGDFVIAEGEGIKIEYALSGDYLILAGPQTEDFVASYQFALALFDVTAGTWNLMDGDYVTLTPFSNDRGSVAVLPVTDFQQLAIRANGVVIVRPPVGTYRVGIYVNAVSTSSNDESIQGQIIFGSNDSGTPKLAAHKVAADCVLSAYDVTDLVPVTPGNVPWSNPA